MTYDTEIYDMLLCLLEEFPEAKKRYEKCLAEKSKTEQALHDLIIDSRPLEFVSPDGFVSRIAILRNAMHGEKECETITWPPQH